MQYHCEYRESFFAFHNTTLLHSERTAGDWYMTFENVCVTPACPENHYLYAMQTPCLQMRLENGVMTGGISYGYACMDEKGRQKQVPDYPFQERDIQDVAELLCTRKNFWVTDGKAVTTDADTMKVFQLALDLQADLQGHYTHFVRIEIRCTRIWLEWDTYRGMAYMPQKRK